MDIKIRHKLIKIEGRVSDRFVILITNYNWLRILEGIRYRCSNRFILKNTRQIYKIHSFIYERDFDKMSLVINFSIGKWTESMLSITSSQKCSLIHLVIPIIKPISLNIQMCKTRMGRELRKESIACRPCSLNFDDKLFREVLDFCAAHLLRL